MTSARGLLLGLVLAVSVTLLGAGVAGVWTDFGGNRPTTPSSDGDLLEWRAVDASTKPFVSDAIDVQKYTSVTLFANPTTPAEASAIVTIYGLPKTRAACPTETVGDVELGRFTASGSIWTRWQHALSQCSIRFTIEPPLPGNGTPPTAVEARVFLSGGMPATPRVAASPSVSPGVPQSPVVTPIPLAQAPHVPHDERYFNETGFRVDGDLVWDYFMGHGGAASFGPPISRSFTLLGCRTQFFQRQALQQCDERPPQPLNLLDPELFPYTHVNGSVFPGVDPILKEATPRVGTPEYAGIIDFVLTHAPDTFDGHVVNFGQTFALGGVDSAQDGPKVMAGLEFWGAPISWPQYDPTNRDFIFQRFERGVMHAATGRPTLGILVADYQKNIMLGPYLGSSLPPDLVAEARDNRFFAQYCPGKAEWLCRPEELPATNLTFAFERD
jgi:hypothetical protein